RAAGHAGPPLYIGTAGDAGGGTSPRPAEGAGRTLVRRRADGTTASALPAPWNVRSRVIEYGGTPWAGVPGSGSRAAGRGGSGSRDGDGGGPLVVFTDFADQRLHRFDPDSEAGPRPLTPLSPAGGGLRWADPVIVPERDEVWCVLEEFTGDAPTDVRRLIAAVPLDGSAADDRTAVRELGDDGHRFVTGPRISPDGRRVAWIAWDHPRMPWEATALKLADLAEDGTFTAVRTVLGGTAPETAGEEEPGAQGAPGESRSQGAPGESVVQVEWAPDGSLLAVTDRTGWWNLHRVDPATGRVEELCPRREEFGGALWRIGLRWFAVLPDGRAAVLHGRGGMRLSLLDPGTGELTAVAGPWTEWSPTLAVRGGRVFGAAASARRSHEVVEVCADTGRTRVVGSPHRDAVDPAHLPEPVVRTFTGPGGREVHAQLYPPRNPGFTAPPGELPPYVVWAHGGPTDRAPVVLDLEIAYFTGRGIGVVEVNYGGSTGYGREYRERLRENWGVVDVEDCAAVARALADDGTADPARLAIRGGSAGGWTVMASLTGPSTAGLYACGAARYPVLDLHGWANGGTHDFESRYLDSLVGPLPGAADRYHDRSPANRADRLVRPFLLLQGLDDAICPPAQCEHLLEAVAGRGVPHAYLSFAGEGHGFRRAETLQAALEAELGLYAQVMGFTTPGVPPLDPTVRHAPGSAGARPGTSWNSLPVPGNARPASPADAARYAPAPQRP
ncbi:prolyl oligopeptidase family serine peptidase, partial [Streptomyces sp. NPDC059506]|uniref:dipeptidyl-peptidase 5 n=1 Tax=Streptomyces sp. NPDC059506 TaxID=3347751 RepID=UPI0036BC75DB